MTIDTAMATRDPLTAAATAHPFLSGLHTPMTAELTLENLRVSGTIPAALEGRYLRIGPNPLAADAGKYHWFTGDGMVHGLAIKDGEALWYRNRWIRSKRAAALLGEAPAPATAFPILSTPTSPQSAAAPSQWSNRAATLSNFPKHWANRPITRSAAPCRAASPPIRIVTR